jgi:hypothetical protein
MGSVSEPAGAETAGGIVAVAVGVAVGVGIGETVSSAAVSVLLWSVSSEVDASVSSADVPESCSLLAGSSSTTAVLTASLLAGSLQASAQKPGANANPPSNPTHDPRFPLAQNDLTFEDMAAAYRISIRELTFPQQAQ